MMEVNLPITGNEWTTITVRRTAGQLRTITHTTETVDGVLFVAMREYGNDGRLERVSMVRGDLVKG
jgi:hypothetical protein